MKINIHAGHTRQTGKSPGASGVLHESTENRKIVKYLKKYLKARGCTVYNCTSEGTDSRDNLRRIVTKCNAHKVDLDVSVHLNCYNGKAFGVETEIHSAGSYAKKYAKRVCENISDRGGFTNRGVKVHPELYVLKNTNASAMLIECFFCDSKKDCAKYKKMGGAKAIAKAIADGICPVK